MLCETEKGSTTKRINAVFNYTMKRSIYVLSNHEVKHLSLLDGRTTRVTAHLFAQFFTSYAEGFRQQYGTYVRVVLHFTAAAAVVSLWNRARQSAQGQCLFANKL